MPRDRKIGKPVVKPRGTGFQARVRVVGVEAKPKDFYGTGATEHEAVANAIKQAHAFDPGLVTHDGGIPFVQFLKDYHTTNDKLKPRTRAAYLDRIAKYIAPVLKNTPIDRLAWGDFHRLKSSITANGAGPATVLAIFRIMSKPMEMALKRKMLTENPLATIELPAQRSAPRKPLSHAQLLKLLEATKGSFWEDHLHVFVATGLRSAELLGLHWRDVVLDGPEPHITVRVVVHDKRYGADAALSSPKTDASRRNVDLPAEIVERLRARWERHHRPGLDSLVFPNPAGGLQDGGSLRHFLGRKARLLGAEALHPHLLRHTMISHALHLTGDLGAVSAMAGHSSPAITAGIYLKGLPGSGRKIATAMGSLFAPQTGVQGALRVQNEGAALEASGQVVGKIEDLIS